MMDNPQTKKPNNMKRTTIIAALLATTMAAAAQETYDNARLASQDLNGTARYVGMGGAMDALGADLSTISTNPAGIGLFRSSQVKLSMGIMGQEDAADFADASKSHVSFDQAGFVYAKRTGRSSFFNFAFNYHKSTDFNQILTAANRLKGASQNKLTYAKYENELINPYVNKDGKLVADDNRFNQVDYLYVNAFMSSVSGNDFELYYNDASDYSFGRKNSGYIGSYEINISGNLNDRLYLGATFGIDDVHYNSATAYSENLIDANGKSIGNVLLQDDRSITGTGFNLKLGVIFRPVAESPLRIGVSVATPTWYKLKSTNYLTLLNSTSEGRYDSGDSQESFKFKLNTPWKFGLSMGTTIDNMVAIGAGYEYADYPSTDTRIIEGDEYDWWTDSWYETSSSDKAMNIHTKRTLEGVHTIKLGAELRAADNIAVRLGYNYVSPMYKDSGVRNVDVNSPYAYYASTTDYTNWDATNRITCGVGFTFERFTLDLGYQYSCQNGTFHPFADSQWKTGNLHADGVKVDNKRHQVVMTMGYRF